jgi:hypothetical protein
MTEMEMAFVPRKRVPLKEPEDLGGGRGLWVYGGREVVTRDGGSLRVQDSSSAMSPHLRLYFTPSPNGSPQPHLSLTDVIELRDRLNQFIEKVPERWTAGDAIVAEAYGEVNLLRAERVIGDEDSP